MTPAIVLGMNAERLRQAADRLDELINGAELGPWESFWEGRDHLGGDSMINTTSSNIYVHVDPRAPDFGKGTQDYIAAMHPGVGKALAELLREAAGSWDFLVALQPDEVPDFPNELAVADAILGPL